MQQRVRIALAESSERAAAQTQRLITLAEESREQTAEVTRLTQWIAAHTFVMLFAVLAQVSLAVWPLR